MDHDDELEVMQSTLQHCKELYNDVTAAQQGLVPRTAPEVADSKRTRQMKVLEVVRAKMETLEDQIRECCLKKRADEDIDAVLVAMDVVRRDVVAACRQGSSLLQAHQELLHRVLAFCEMDRSEQVTPRGFPSSWNTSTSVAGGRYAGCPASTEEGTITSNASAFSLATEASSAPKSTAADMGRKLPAVPAGLQQDLASVHSLGSWQKQHQQQPQQGGGRAAPVAPAGGSHPRAPTSRLAAAAQPAGGQRGADAAARLPPGGLLHIGQAAAAGASEIEEEGSGASDPDCDATADDDTGDGRTSSVSAAIHEAMGRRPPVMHANYDLHQTGVRGPALDQTTPGPAQSRYGGKLSLGAYRQQEEQDPLVPGQGAGFQDGVGDYIRLRTVQDQGVVRDVDPPGDARKQRHRQSWMAQSRTGPLRVRVVHDPVVGPDGMASAPAGGVGGGRGRRFASRVLKVLGCAAGVALLAAATVLSITATVEDLGDQFGGRAGGQGAGAADDEADPFPMPSLPNLREGPHSGGGGGKEAAEGSAGGDAARKRRRRRRKQAPADGAELEGVMAGLRVPCMPPPDVFTGLTG